MSDMNATATDGQYLSFTLNGEDYGVDILKVQEIKGWEEVRPLPDTPEYVKGVLDFRGTIVPVIDLRKRFNLGRADFVPTTVTIVVSVEADDATSIVGVVVDSVSDVLDVAQKDIRKAPNLGTKIKTRYLQGVVNIADRMVVLLDLDELLNPEELGVADVVG